MALQKFDREIQMKQASRSSNIALLDFRLQKFDREIQMKQSGGIKGLNTKSPVTEIDLAAVLDCDRKEVIESLFLSGVVPHLKIGNRFVTTARLITAAIENLAQSREEV